MLSLLLLLCLQDPAAPGAEEIRRIDALFARWSEPGSPGAAVGIVRGGRLAHARGYGSADIEQGVPFGPDTVTYVGSVAKQFTALAVQLLAAEGRIELEGDVRELLAELPDHGARITFDQLLHHASGLRDYLVLARWAGYRPTGDLLTREEALDLVLRQRATSFAPGTRFEYSNTGYLLLALAVERASGSSFEGFVAERILGPLGMHSSRVLADARELVPRLARGYERGPGGGLRHGSDRWFKLGPGGLYTTVRDLARWTANFRDPVVGTREILARMERPITYLDGTRGEEGTGLVPDSYRGLRVVHHAGNARGYGAEVLRFPDHDLAVIVVANAGIRELRPTSIALRIADVLLEQALDPLEPGDAAASAGPEVPAEAEAETLPPAPPVEGVYAGARRGQFFRLRLGAAGWEGDYGGQPAFALVPVVGEPDRLAIAGTAESLRFLFEGAERPVALEYRAGPGAAPSRYERIPELGPAEAAELAGTYATPELPSAWEVSIAGTGLAIRVAGKTWTLFEGLDRIGADVFTDGEESYFEFRRGEDGAVTALVASEPRVGSLELRRALD